MLWVGLVILALAIYLGMKYEFKSLFLMNRVFTRGASSLGHEKSSFVECPSCKSKVKREDPVYCSACNKYF